MILALQHVRKLPATAASKYAVAPQALADAVVADLAAGLIPFFFMGTIGTHCVAAWRRACCSRLVGKAAAPVCCGAAAVRRAGGC
jgi:hypothetical protein